MNLNLNDQCGSKKWLNRIMSVKTTHCCYCVQKLILSTIKQFWGLYLCSFLIWTVEGKCLIFAIFDIISWIMVTIISLMIIYQPQMHSPGYFGCKNCKISKIYFRLIKVVFRATSPIKVWRTHRGVSPIPTVPGKGVSRTL